MSDSADRVGRYQLLGPIGTGPSGVVSRAKVYGVAGFERQFAVKRFHPEVTITSPLAQALSAAARAYGSLEHPRIARMSEFGVAQGQTFTAVELVAGVDAARLVAEARLQGLVLAAGGALALVSQAARAVGYAHGRGLTHLGLAPTNMIVTADGDVKITDFGILAASLPQRPAEVARLARRIQYLAPEQLAGEATSAATDVFQLGVIAYELVTGEPTFRGETAAQIAQAILAGPPAEPALPRPIVRVLARCLARSPFERFPDARALADALDAALRVAPVPGTRKDVGAQVQATLDRLASLNEGELSGMVALHVGTGPVVRHDYDERDLHENSTIAIAPDLATEEFVRPDTEVPGPTPLVGPSVSARPAALPTPPPTTSLPAPPLRSGLARTPAPGAKPTPSTTLMGIPPVRGVPPIKPPPAIPAIKPPSEPPAIARTKSSPEVPKTIPAMPAIAPRSADAPPAVAHTKSADVPPLPPAVARTKSSDVPPPPPAVARTKSSDVPPPPPAVARTKSAPNLPPAVPPQRRTSPGAATPSPLVARTISDLGLDGDSVSGGETSPSLRPPTVLPRPTSLPSPVTDEPSGGLDVEELFEGVLTNAGARPITSLPSDGLDGGATVLGSQTVLGIAPAAAPPPTAQSSTSKAAPTPTPTRNPISSPTPHAASPHATTRHTPSPHTPSPHATSPHAAPTSHAASPQTTPTPTPTPPTTPAPTARAPREVPTAEMESLERERLVAQSERAAEPLLSPDLAATPQISVAASTLPGSPPPARAAAPRSMPAPGAGMLAAQQDPPKKSRAPLVAAIVLLGGGGLAVGGWQVYERVLAKHDDTGPTATKVVAAATPDAAATAPSIDAANAVDAASAVAASTDAAATPADAAAPADAAEAVAAVVDAAAPTPTPATSGSSDALSISSTPSGARVYLDGADAGVTPIELPASLDKHTIALFLPKHDLYIAQVDGAGKFQIQLTEAPRFHGEAGIKVLRCKDEHRYYVYVDGKPTGMMCPSGRIHADVGPHTVEIYDTVTESRRKWDIDIKDTRLSFRVKIE